MAASDLLAMVETIEGLHAIIIEANRVSVGVQAALNLPHGLPGLTFHGALDKINRICATLDKAEEHDA